MPMYTLARTTTPKLPPVSLEELKDQVGIPQASTSADGELLKLASAAAGSLEKATGGRVFRESGFRFGLPSLPAGSTAALELPKYQATKIDRVAYFDSENQEQEITDDLELVAGSFPSLIAPIFGKSWPDPCAARGFRPNTLLIDFTADGPADDQTEASVAILQAVALWFGVKSSQTDRKIEDVPAAKDLITRLHMGTTWEDYAVS